MNELVVVDEKKDLAELSVDNLAFLKDQRRLFLDFVKSQMIEGIDYGRHGGAKKDTLLKPGAEKLLRLFGLGSRIKKKEQTIEKDPPFAMVSYIMEVYSLRTDKVLAECEGSQNSMEPQHRRRHPLEVLNTLQKMAQKRALVGAVITATGSSELFTQDLEDDDIHKDGPRPLKNGAYDVSQEVPKSRKNLLIELGGKHNWTVEQFRMATTHFFHKSLVSDLTDPEFKMLCDAVSKYSYEEVINRRGTENATEKGGLQ